MPNTHRTRIAQTGLLILVVVASVLAQLWAQQKPASSAAAAEALMGTAQYQEEVEGNPNAAIATYRKVLAAPGVARTLAARAQFRIGACYERLGLQEAKKAYGTVVRNFADQADIVKLAQTRLSALTTSSVRARNDGPTLRRLAAGAGADDPTYGVISPDGRLIAYDSYDKNGVETIGVRDLSTGETRHLAQGPCILDGGFAWSGSSTQIAFDCWTKDAMQFRIIGLADTTSRLLLAAQDRFDGFDFSPDGISAFVLVRSRGAATRLVAVSTKDGTVRTLKTEGEQAGGSVRTSADGRFVAYELSKAGDPSDQDVYVIPVSGGDPIAIVATSRREQLVGWTPDGRGLVYVDHRSDSVGLWWIPVIDGKRAGESQRIWTEIRGIQASSARITKDGALVCTTGGVTSVLYTATLDAAQSRLVGPPREAAEGHSGYAGYPSWAPDGQSLAFLTAPQATSPPRLVVLTPESRQMRELTLQVRPSLSDLRWSTDGRWLWYGGWLSNGSTGIYRVNIQNGEAVPVPNASRLSDAPISRDGKKAYYRGPRSTGPGTGMVRDLETGEDRELYHTAGPGAVYGFELSPDEKWIAINERLRTTPATYSVKLIPSSGGTGKELFRRDAGANPLPYVRWSPDSQKVHVVTTGKGLPTEFWTIPINGSTPTKADISPLDPSMGFSVHPDGKQITFTSASREPTELWILEHFLPPSKGAATPLARK